MKHSKTILILALITAMATDSARACGRDYFICDPSNLPEGGHTLLLPTYKWDRHDGEDSFEASFGVVHPIHPRVAFDGYFSFSDDGEGWEMETVTPGFLFDLTPDMENDRVRFGLFAAYKFAVNGGDDDEFISANQLDARDQFESRFIIETDVT
jgi:hypothetical protein